MGLGAQAKGGQGSAVRGGHRGVRARPFPCLLAERGQRGARVRREGAVTGKAEAGQDDVIRVGKKGEQGGWLCG